MVVNKETEQKIDRYINEHKEEITEALRELVEIPSLRKEATADLPYGKAVDDVLNKSLEIFAKHGFEGKKAESKKYIVAEGGSGNKTMGLFAHGDVVSVDGEWLYGEPFKLTECNGFFVGRGCLDDKCGILQILYAAEIIRELKIPFNSKIVFFVGGNEEDGMDDIDDFVKNEPMPDVSIVPDGEYPYYSAEKSRIKLMLESEKRFDKIAGLSGGKAYNIVLNELNIEYTNGEKEMEKGISAHAAHPENGENALLKFAKRANQNTKISADDKIILKETEKILEDCYGSGLGIENTDEFFGNLTIANGIVNTVNGKMKISLDIRHGTGIKCVEILEKIKENTKGIWRIAEESFANGYIIDENGTIATALREVYGTVIGDKKIMGKKTGGGTYSKHLKNSYSIGTVMRNLGAKNDFCEGHGSEHQPDESIHIQGFFDAIKMLTMMMIEVDSVL